MDEPLRHWMPPGDGGPLCGSIEGLPYRAIDGKPITCPGCVVLFCEAAGVPSGRAPIPYDSAGNAIDYRRSSRALSSPVDMVGLPPGGAE